MIARLKTKIWVIAPELDYETSTSSGRSKLVGQEGDLISIEPFSEDSFRGTLLAGSYKDYYATDLDNWHFKVLSPLELLANCAEE